MHVTDRWDDIEPESAAESALTVLVREVLLERTAKLDGPRLAAFVDGWTSALDLLGRVELILPTASPALREALLELLARIKTTQIEALEDDDLP